MFDYLLTKDQISLRDEVREFIKWVPRRMVLDMDKDEIKFPKEFLREAGRRNLMGCRYPRQWGGRGMNWVATGMVPAPSSGGALCRGMPHRAPGRIGFFRRHLFSAMSWCRKKMSWAASTGPMTYLTP